MTSGEARIVAAIALTADGGCPYCAEALLEQLVEAFPEHAKTLIEPFIKEFPEHEITYTAVADAKGAEYVERAAGGDEP